MLILFCKGDHNIKQRLWRSDHLPFENEIIVVKHIQQLKNSKLNPQLILNLSHEVTNIIYAITSYDNIFHYISSVHSS